MHGADLKPQEIQIEANEFLFTSSHPTLQKGQPVVLTLINKGKLLHEFISSLFEGGKAEVEWDGVVVEGRGIEEIELPPGKMVKITFTPRKIGKIDFICNIPGHLKRGMKGSIVVQ